MNLCSRVWKWLEPPDPVELGRSERLALPIRLLSEPDSYTWEDWEEEVRKSHPVRFWITHTAVRRAWYPIRRKVLDTWYWVQCKVLPSYRFHLLDLRNPAPDIPYNYGWLGTSTVVAYACFTILRKFVEEGDLKDPAEWETPDNSDQLTEQKSDYDEIMALYHWWMVGRRDEDLEEQRLWRASKGIPKGSPDYKSAFDAWLAYHEWCGGARVDEMLHRLINLRQRLWD